MWITECNKFLMYDINHSAKCHKLCWKQVFACRAICWRSLRRIRSGRVCTLCCRTRTAKIGSISSTIPKGRNLEDSSISAVPISIRLSIYFATFTTDSYVQYPRKVHEKCVASYWFTVKNGKFKSVYLLKG